jgi:hypothetical protein
MANPLLKRFQELTDEAGQIELTQQPHGSMTFVDADMLLNWIVKTKTLIQGACGIESQHFMHFTQAAHISPHANHIANLKAMKAVLLATRDDYEGGYLTSTRSLIQAEMFDSELEQASELLRSGYKTAAAVIAGTVLETSLRELCNRHQQPVGKLDRMNADLAKHGLYNANMAKRIISLAGIRNSAAHGKPNEFSDADVKSMIEEIERFLAQYLP